MTNKFVTTDIVGHVDYPESVFKIKKMRVGDGGVRIVKALAINKYEPAFSFGGVYHLRQDHLVKISDETYNLFEGDLVKHKVAGASFKVQFWDDTWHVSALCVKSAGIYQKNGSYTINAALLEKRMKKKKSCKADKLSLAPPAGKTTATPNGVVWEGVGARFGVSDNQLPYMENQTSTQIALVSLGNYVRQNNAAFHKERRSDAVFQIKTIRSNGSVSAMCVRSDSYGHHTICGVYEFEPNEIEIYSGPTVIQEVMYSNGDIVCLDTDTKAVFRVVQPTIKVTNYYDCLCIQGSDEFVLQKVYPFNEDKLSILKDIDNKNLAKLEVGDIVRYEDSNRALFIVEKICTKTINVQALCVQEDTSLLYEAGSSYYLMPPKITKIPKNEVKTEDFEVGTLFSLAKIFFFEGAAEFVVNEIPNDLGILRCKCFKPDGNFEKDTTYRFHHSICIPDFINMGIAPGDFFYTQNSTYAKFEAVSCSARGVKAMCVQDGRDHKYAIGSTYTFTYREITYPLVDAQKKSKEKSTKKKSTESTKSSSETRTSQGFIFDYHPGDVFSLVQNPFRKFQVIYSLGNGKVLSKFISDSPSETYKKDNEYEINVRDTEPGSVAHLATYPSYSINSRFFIRSSPDILFRVVWVSEKKDIVEATCITENDSNKAIGQIEQDKTYTIHTLHTVPLEYDFVMPKDYCTLYEDQDTLFHVKDGVVDVCSPTFEAMCIKGNNRTCVEGRKYTLHCANVFKSYVNHEYKVNEVFTLLNDERVFFKVAEIGQDYIIGICITSNSKTHSFKGIYTFKKSELSPKSGSLGMPPFVIGQRVRLAANQDIEFKILSLKDDNRLIEVHCTASTSGEAVFPCNLFVAGRHYELPLTKLLPENRCPHPGQLVSHESYGEELNHDSAVFEAKYPNPPFAYTCVCKNTGGYPDLKLGEEKILLLEHLMPLQKSFPFKNGDVVCHKSYRESRFKVIACFEDKKVLALTCVATDGKSTEFILNCHYRLPLDEIRPINFDFTKGAWASHKDHSKSKFVITSLVGNNKVVMECIISGNSKHIPYISYQEDIDNLKLISPDYKVGDAICYDNVNFWFVRFENEERTKLSAICHSSASEKYAECMEYVLNTEDVKFFSRHEPRKLIKTGQTVIGANSPGAIFQVKGNPVEDEIVAVKCMCPDKEGTFSLGQEYQFSCNLLVPLRITERNEPAINVGDLITHLDYRHLIFKVLAVRKHHIDATCIKADAALNYFYQATYTLLIDHVAKVSDPDNGKAVISALCKFTPNEKVFCKQRPTAIFEVTKYLTMALDAANSLVKLKCLREDIRGFFKIYQSYELPEDELDYHRPADNDDPLESFMQV